MLETPAQLLAHALHSPALLPPLREEWVNDTVRAELARAKDSVGYLTQLEAYYDRKRHESPRSLPYTFAEYAELRRARPLGAKAFGEAMEKITPRTDEDREAKVRADFEAAKRNHRAVVQRHCP